MIDEYGELYFEFEESEPYIEHYGMPRRSGRYPWGSGDNPYQHGSGDFISRVEALRKENITYTDPETGQIYTGDTAVAKTLGMSTTQLRARLAMAKNERRATQYDKAVSMREDGHTLQEIADALGMPNESSVRSLLNKESAERMNKAITTANTLKALVDEKGLIDVGDGVDTELHISKEKLNQALEILQDEGYEVYGFGLPQLTNPGKQTNFKVIAPPGTTYSEVYALRDKGEIHSVIDYAKNEGGVLLRDNPKEPVSISSDRVKVIFADEIGPEGFKGVDRDGMIFLKPGVADLDMGGSHYAQVRIAVDGENYIKGMAIYGDPKWFPPGQDIIVNSNKSGPEKSSAFKSMKDDPDNRFGALIKENGQTFYLGDDGNMHQGVINKVREEGDWNEWSKGLPSQFLGKQSMALIHQQLSLAIADKEDEFESIKSLNNPTIKKHFLKEFADQCDADAVRLQAASLPGQKWKVIFSDPSLKPNEIYDPTHSNGEEVALIRYPHGGTFEIPVCKVNNKHKSSKDLLGNAPDAIAMNPKTAQRLSGADFDGDTVMVIPTGKSRATKIISSDVLPGLKGFEPKDKYATTEKLNKDGTKTYLNKDGVPIKVMKNTQNEMGRVSNLITDMTLKGATSDELARAVRHSMVVIDAEKHHLDYKASERDNDISGLKKKYQTHIVNGKESTGASTLLSRAKSPVEVPETRGQPYTNPKTGELDWTGESVGRPSKYTGRSYVNSKGKTVLATKTSTQMMETKDARSLSSGTDQENAYADYANALKSMGNQARKELLSTGNLKYSKEAKATYAPEVKSLNDKLDIAIANRPRERQAQAIAYGRSLAKKEANPDMTSSEYKKVKQVELAKARVEVGSSGKDRRIEITDREWKAIQSGAITENTLSKILDNSDPDSLRQRATPRQTTTLPQARINKIQAMAASDYTIAEIADNLGVSTTTVSKYL